MSGSNGNNPRLLDWRLAEHVAVAISGAGGAPVPVRADPVEGAAARAIEQVASYTELEPLAVLPQPELVDRAEWIRANLATFRGMSADLELRLTESVRIAEPLRGLTRRVAGTVGGTQLGLVLGYVGRKVLGQYDVAILGPDRPPRLLFVGPNLTDAHARLGGDGGLFLHWIALHEATHAFQFASVPWLRGHLGGMVEELLDGATLGADLAALRENLKRMVSRPDPRRLAVELRDEGLVMLVAGPAQREVLGRLQATMAVIEGYAEHVMDAIGDELDPGYARLREAIEAERRRRGMLDAIAVRLLGLDMKLRQYGLGKRFADFVAARSGITGLNAVWREPAALPRMDELESPDRWLARVGRGSNQDPALGGEFDVGPSAN
jgi:coenzyme F420 biosynthesis associated uncharacterized protein